MDGNGRKKRAVGLTEEALELLKQRLNQRFAEYSKQYGSPRLTREIRSELLTVSIRTADRILDRQPVDRSTLMAAFEAVGLQWKDGFLDRQSPPESQPLNQVEAQFAETPKASTAPGFKLLGFGVALLLFGFLAAKGLGQKSATPVNDPFAYQKILTATLNEASLAYHRAEYPLAWRLVRKAEPIARSHRDSADVAWILRIKSDLQAVEGNAQEALKTIEEALVFFRVDERTEGYYFSALEAAAVLKTRLGRLDQAEVDFRQCLDHAERKKNITDISASCRGLGTVEYERKHYAKALTWFDRGLGVLSGGVEVNMSFDLRARRALAIAALGDTDAALATLESCLAHWKGENHTRWIATTRYQLANVHALLGNHEATVELLNLSKEGYRRVGDRAGVAKCDRLLAQEGVARR